MHWDKQAFNVYVCSVLSAAYRSPACTRQTFALWPCLPFWLTSLLQNWILVQQTNYKSAPGTHKNPQERSIVAKKKAKQTSNTHYLLKFELYWSFATSRSEMLSTHAENGNHRKLAHKPINTNLCTIDKTSRSCKTSVLEKWDQRSPKTADASQTGSCFLKHTDVHFFT